MQIFLQLIAVLEETYTARTQPFGADGLRIATGSPAQPEPARSGQVDDGAIEFGIEMMSCAIKSIERYAADMAMRSENPGINTNNR